MKKTILILILCFIATTITTQAQHEKGDIMTSLLVSPFPTTSDNQDDFGIIGKINLEFFVSNKVSFSGSFFTTNNTLITNDSGLTIHSYGFIPSIQYYLLNNEKFNLFAQLGYGFGFEDRTRREIENSALTVFSGGFGANYKVADKLYIKGTLPYFKGQNITIDEKAADGIAVFLGINYAL